MLMVSRAGVYKFAFTSRKPEITVVPSPQISAHPRWLSPISTLRQSGLCADEQSSIRTSECGPAVNVIDDGAAYCAHQRS